MKAMILAAGEGRRMRPLTDNRPKPLLTVRGVSSLEHHIVRLRDAGVTSLVVNASHLGDQIEHFCGDGSAWGVTIQISREVQPLETAGGIVAALPHLGGEPFLVVNGDVFTDFSFATLLKVRVRPRGGTSYWWIIRRTTLMVILGFRIIRFDPPLPRSRQVKLWQH